MSNREEKIRYLNNKKFVVIGIIAFAILMSIWVLELNGIISKTLFYIGAFCLIITGLLLRVFFYKKGSRNNWH
jgi:hypothetical protein